MMMKMMMMMMTIMTANINVENDYDDDECVRMCGGLAAERSRIPGTLLIPHNYTFQDHYISYILHSIHCTL